MRPVFVVLLIFGMVPVSTAALADSVDYAWKATPNNPQITIDEGKRAVVTYTFTNLGTKDIFIFDFVLSASLPVFPDATDFVSSVGSFGNFTGGLKVKPGESITFGYFLGTDIPGRHETPPDFGLQFFVPDISKQLRECDSITCPSVPVGAGKADSFGVIVQDVAGGTVPEPSAYLMFGTGLVGVAGMIRRKLRR